MQIFQKISIKQKLTLIIMLISSIALLLACVGFILYDRTTFKNAMIRDLHILAEIIGENSRAALIFDDESDAKNILAALRAEEHIISACIYTKDDEVLANYLRGDVKTGFSFPKPESDSYHFREYQLDLFRQIILDGVKIGTVYIQSDLEEMHARLKRYAIIVFLFMLGSSVVAFLMTSRLQQVISKPILYLAKIANEVSVKKDYSVRVEKSSEDELGFLTERFNEMLAQIQNRDTALQKAHNELEDRAQELQKELTERKRAEEALAAEKERLAVTLRSIGDGVITTDIKGEIVLVNKVAEALTGWAQEEAIGKPIEEIFHIIDEETRMIRENPVMKVLETKGIVEHANHTILIAKDNTERIIADSGAPIHDIESKVVGVVLVFRDITEKQRTEKELQKAQKLESVGILAGGIAHDFNNILTAILGNVSLAKEFTLHSDEIFELLEATEKASLRAKGLTQQLLTFSKGGLPVKKTTSIAELIKDSVNFALRGSNVKCEISIPGDIYTVEIDEGQINQVINNLIINADQAMPEGGIIYVKAKNIIIDEKFTIPLKEGKYIKISIQDQGVGITEKHISKIFDPYFTTKQKGSGLGLATTYSIIKNHDGFIAVESKLKIGTTFSIYLPASEKSILKEEKMKEERASGKGKILVMDDDEAIKRLILRMLPRFGYEGEVANDGVEAIQLYKKAKASKSPFDVVIMDLTIPGGMGGKEAIKKLLQFDPQAKAIVASGYSNDPVMANFKQYGFIGVISKPYNFEDLNKTLIQVINQPVD